MRSEGSISLTLLLGCVIGIIAPFFTNTVLNKQTDIDVFIEGHTDNKPINTVQFKDNWDLSVIRATSVVRILIKNYNVNPLQIQPSGRGEYMPVDDNETIEGRSKNRRTEIIMAPKLDKLFQMLQSSEESK